jgi:hypothetical protein
MLLKNATLEIIETYTIEINTMFSIKIHFLKSTMEMCKKIP